MRRAALIGVVVIACGSKAEPKETKAGEPPVDKVADKPKAERFGKVKQAEVSAVCAKARLSFGYGAECIETELAELTTAAGKVVRVVDKKDETASWLYVLVRPDGTMFLGDGGSNGRILDEITKVLDLAATPPETLAVLYATLDMEAALVRCLPGTDDTLPPDKHGKQHACTPPAVAKKGDQLRLTFIVEQFPHPALLNRDDHRIWRETIAVREHELSLSEGDGLIELPADASPPASPLIPPRPRMTTPPAWVAKPVEAPADVSAALCAEASKRISGIEGRQCKAYGYPSLELPTGSLYYLANDAGQRHRLALKKPDGTIVAGFDLDTSENPLVPIIKSYDPAVVPPAKFLAAHLFLQGEAANILCLPGSGDVIPGHACEPPTAVKKGEDLVVTGILEELPFPDEHGNVPDPAVRSFSIELTPGGGSLGGGTRLIDMRDP